MSTVLRRIDTNARENLHTPEKSLRKQFNTQGHRSAKKYRAADFLEIALKHERSGNKELALSAYEDAAENISNNTKILAKIEQLKSLIKEEFETIAAQKKQALLQQQEKEARRRQEEEILRTREEDERDFYDTEGEVSMMTEDNESFYDDETTASTLYSEYDPEKRALILQQLQAKTQSALEYQLLDRLNKGDKEELLQLKQIGNIRATGILQLREQFADDDASGDGLYFTSLEQLEDIYMKPKEIKSFLRQNAVFLLGL